MGVVPTNDALEMGYKSQLPPPLGRTLLRRGLYTRTLGFPVEFRLLTVGSGIVTHLSSAASFLRIPFPLPNQLLTLFGFQLYHI